AGTTAGGPSIGLEANDGAKQQALQLLAQAKQYQQQNNLVTARQKIVEAQQLKAEFGPEETSPGQMLLQLASIAHQRIHRLMMDADECMKNATGNPQLYAKANMDLKEAKQLAVCYGMDTLPIDSKLGFMRQMASNNSKAPTPATYPTAEPAVAANAQQGKGL